MKTIKQKHFHTAQSGKRSVKVYISTLSFFALVSHHNFWMQKNHLSKIHAYVALKRLVSFFGHPAACGARIADIQTK